MLEGTKAPRQRAAILLAAQLIAFVACGGPIHGGSGFTQQPTSDVPSDVQRTEFDGAAAPARSSSPSAGTGSGAERNDPVAPERVP
jgi:hypothetical protein